MIWRVRRLVAEWIVWWQQADASRVSESWRRQSQYDRGGDRW
jgi:hypothetical protein